jgi:hypothetical protein
MFHTTSKVFRIKPAQESLLQNSIEIAKRVRARLQSCRKVSENILGFSPCAYLFSVAYSHAAAKAGV